MALTRKWLSALGIEADKVDEIIQNHTEVTDALKSERDQYKADAEKLPGVQAELDAMKKASEAQEKDPWKVKYEAIKEEFDQYKTEIQTKETKAAKETAYRALLAKAGIPDKRLDAVLKVSDVDSITLDKDGNIEDSDNLLKGIKDEWSDFIPTKSVEGAKTPTPPASKGGVLSREDIYKRDEHGRFVMDATQRQEALQKIINSERMN